MIRLMLYAVLTVISIPLFAQQNLSGCWELTERKSLEGPDFTNGVPRLIKINQTDKNVTIEFTSDLGGRDTIFTQSLRIGSNQINEGLTNTGKRKTITYFWDTNKQQWVMQSLIFAKNDSGKQERMVEEGYSLIGGDLKIFAKSKWVDNAKKDGNYNIEGSYQKTSSEKLAYKKSQGRGVQFLEGLTWEQIKAKAKAENKYIFVDCYATWCGPCKVMDIEVYPLNAVGDVLNGKFISVKIQMDSTKTDADHIKLLRPAAQELGKKYNISALPTYLFFDKKGVIVHKAIGQLSPKDFIMAVSDATQADKQLFTLVNQAKQGNLPYSEYPSLAMRLRNEFREPRLALEIARMYKVNFLDKLTEKELLTKSYLDFIGEYYYLIQSGDNFFKLCYEQPELVDKVKEYKDGGWANFQISQTIQREQVQPMLNQAEIEKREPMWGGLERTLEKKYNKTLAVKFILNAKVNWYQKKEQWVEYLKYLPIQLEQYDLQNYNPIALNMGVWNVFKNSQDMALMTKALTWIDIAISRWPYKDAMWMVMDTKARLIYKMGKNAESIALMQKVIDMDSQLIKSFQPTLDKMKRGEKIWLDKD